MNILITGSSGAKGVKAMAARRVYWLIFFAKEIKLLSATEVDPNAQPPFMQGETGRTKISAAMAKRYKRTRGQPSK